MDLTNRLQFYRKRQGLSQIELAEALQVSRQTVSKWETGAALPSAENLLALSQLYGVSVDALLGGGEEEAAPEPALIPEAAPLLDTVPAPGRPSRRKLVLKILAVLLPLDLLFFFMDISWYSVENSFGFASFSMLARILTCCAIGLVFAWLDRRSPFSKRASLLIAAAALVLALYPILFSTPLLWRLYDLIVWSGYKSFEANIPPNSLRTFIGWTLFDEYAILSHMLLVLFFQLGRLRFSRKRSRTAPQPQAAHQI